MTSNDHSNKPRQPAPFARLLAFVLLAFLSYGATAEVAHKHCNIVPERRSDLTANVSSSDNTNPSSSNTRSGGECLICQLHQHLFVSLLSALPQIAAPPVQSVRPPAAAVSYLSHADTPQRGRAPPTTSLL
ncbi:MAG TPA: DUF2946 family protein [Pyrinomonadaceae bacterium]